MTDLDCSNDRSISNLLACLGLAAMMEGQVGWSRLAWSGLSRLVWSRLVPTEGEFMRCVALIGLVSMSVLSVMAAAPTASAQVAVMCQPGDTIEETVCESDTSGGCPSAPNNFAPIVLGETKCGTSWATRGVREWVDYRRTEPGRRPTLQPWHTAHLVP